MRELEAALARGRATDELPVRPEYWALALMNVGIAELWAGHPDAARQHLEDALEPDAPDLTAVHRGRVASRTWPSRRRSRGSRCRSRSS